MTQQSFKNDAHKFRQYNNFFLHKLLQLIKMGSCLLDNIQVLKT